MYNYLWAEEVKINSHPVTYCEAPQCQREDVKNTERENPGHLQRNNN